MTGPVQKNLPSGWMMTTLGILCERPQYGWTTSATIEGSGAKLLRSTDISRGTVDWDTVPFCESLPPVIEKYQLHAGDIVITRTGAGVGNSLLLDECPLAVFASYLIRFRPQAAVSAKYVAYFLKSPSYKNLVSFKSAGIAQPNVNANKLASLEIPVAPRETQDAIVAEIEKQFTRLDAAVAALKRVQANLKRYRASVLKAACEGRLVPTEADLARRENRSYEPASVLLGRILPERRSRREVSYVLSPQQVSDLPRLPEGWIWTTTVQVGQIQLGRQRAPQHHTGPHMRPYLRVANVFEDRIDTTDVLRMNFSPAEFATYGLKFGDILLNEGQSLELVGRPAMYRNEVPGACFQNTLIRFTVYSGLEPRYALAVFLAYLHNKRFQKAARWTVNIAHLGAERLSSIEFPLPPIAEQGRIADEIERRLTMIAEIETEVKTALVRAQRLRQSTLKMAFEGRLMPQEATDEPASLLLERIRAEREVESRGSSKGAKEVVTR
jgi:type I restriction enzyme S subunit